MSNRKNISFERNTFRNVLNHIICKMILTSLKHLLLINNFLGINPNFDFINGTLKRTRFPKIKAIIITSSLSIFFIYGLYGRSTEIYINKAKMQILLDVIHSSSITAVTLLGMSRIWFIKPKLYQNILADICLIQNQLKQFVLKRENEKKYQFLAVVTSNIFLVGTQMIFDMLACFPIIGLERCFRLSYAFEPPRFYLLFLISEINMIIWVIKNIFRRFNLVLLEILVNHRRYYKILNKKDEFNYSLNYTGFYERIIQQLLVIYCSTVRIIHNFNKLFGSTITSYILCVIWVSFYIFNHFLERKRHRFESDLAFGLYITNFAVKMLYVLVSTCII